MGPNGPRTGLRQVSQSHTGVVAAAGIPGRIGVVREIPELFMTLGNRAPGRPWLVTAQSGTGTVRAPQLDGLSPEDRDQVAVNPAQQVADVR